MKISSFNRSVVISLLLFINTPVFSEEQTDDWVTRDCLLEPNMVIDLASPVSGVIASIRVDRGEAVKKGDTLVTLRSEEEQALVNLYRAEVAFSKQTIKRNDELYQQDLISAQERDELALKRDLAKLQLNTARVKLRLKRIDSPIDGVVLEKMMDPGEYVHELPVLKIASLDPLNVEAVLPSEMFGSVNTGMQAELFLEEPVNATHHAEVTVVDRVIDAASATFGVRLKLSNSGHEIPAGIKCRLRFR